MMLVMNNCFFFCWILCCFVVYVLGLVIFVVVVLVIVGYVYVQGDEFLQFSEGFLMGGWVIDMQCYVLGNFMEFGVYFLDVVVNGWFYDKCDIIFVVVLVFLGVILCLFVGLVCQLLLKEMFLVELDQEDESCVVFFSLIVGVIVEFDEGNLQFLVNVLQVVQVCDVCGYVVFVQCDYGVMVVFFDYNINYNCNQDQQVIYLGLNMGVNLGVWWLCYCLFFSQGSYGLCYDVISSMLQCDFLVWNVQLLFGQGMIGGELFELLLFVGVWVVSDECMLLDLLCGFVLVV